MPRACLRPDDAKMDFRIRLKRESRMKSNSKRVAAPKPPRELPAKPRKAQRTAYGKALIKAVDALAQLGPFDFGAKYRR